MPPSRKERTLVKPPGKRGPGRPVKYKPEKKPVRLGVYLPPDLMDWLWEEFARRKQARRGASLSEIVADAENEYRSNQ